MRVNLKPNFLLSTGTGITWGVNFGGDNLTVCACTERGLICPGSSIRRQLSLKLKPLSTHLILQLSETLESPSISWSKCFLSYCHLSGNTEFFSVRLGNEADFYNANGDRAASYDVSQYTTECVFILSTGYFLTNPQVDHICNKHDEDGESR
jgi:hypothetical protein